MRRPFIVCAIALAGAAAGCSQPTAPVDERTLPEGCLHGLYVEATLVSTCLRESGVIDASTFRRADSVVRELSRLRDSIKLSGDPTLFYKATELTRALGHLSYFYGRGLLTDTARFDRVVDILLVTEDLVRGRLTPTQPGGSRYMPARTPGLVWVYYNSNGIFFQPVTTIQRVFLELPDSVQNLDSLMAMGERMDRYAVWHEADGRRFPVWEYLFSFQTAGVFLSPPWQSAMSQGKMLALYTEVYRRTGSPIWRARADLALNAFKTRWDRGGVLVPDTSHGYWWDEYDPVDRVWNGSVIALLGLGRYAKVTGDAEAQRMFARGVEAVKYWTPYYDSGTWTYYSFNQGLNSRAYHALHVKLLRLLYDETRDPWFSEMADTWAAYTPPAGVN